MLLKLINQLDYVVSEIDGSPVTNFALKEYQLMPKNNESF